MAYKNFALYFKRNDQIVYEIITNTFTQSFMSASLTHLCPSNSLWSNYQTHRLHKIQIIVTIFLLIFKIFLQKKNCLYIYRERKRI